MEKASNARDRVKKRKVRKGTQSCWECKRRKIRCTFATPRNTVCDGCNSRQTRCIGQEYDDDAAQNVQPIGQLGGVKSPIKGKAMKDAADTQDLTINPRSNHDVPASISAAGDLISDLDHSDSRRVSSALLLEWPSETDLEQILTVPVGSSVLFHGLICRSYTELSALKNKSARDMLQPPTEGMHPVLIARKLLLLATFLQSVPTSAAGTLAGMSLDFKTVMSRAFDTATKLVTTNDELTNSLEGIECIMMESMFLNNAGCLRRAWLTNRRAMGIAQIMRLHIYGASSWPVMSLEKDTKDRIDPKYMWFRLVVSDRYLSLMLGLPQGCIESSFAGLSVLDDCTPLERMERMEAVATSLILQRSGAELIEIAETHRIDSIIRSAAALMPPQWWLTSPSVQNIASGGAEAFEESIRLTAHFAHHHLLVQLHLPYILLPSSREIDYGYNKMTAANSSREVLIRFVLFRTSTSTSAYCRGVDFIAFIASTTLCLAHMQAIRPSGSGNDYTTFQCLQHQRQSDRGLLERTLELMEKMALTENDIVARKISSILKPLLAIENNSLKGGCYRISTSSETSSQEFQCVGDPTEDVHGVRIQIPYIGTICIDHCPDSSEIEMSEQMLTTSSKPANDYLPISHEQSLLFNGSGGEERTDVSRAAECEVATGQTINTNWQAVANFLDPPAAIDQIEMSHVSNQAVSKETCFIGPEFGTDPDDWILQGVDMVLFNNLLVGSSDFRS